MLVALYLIGQFVCVCGCEGSEFSFHIIYHCSGFKKKTHTHSHSIPNSTAETRPRRVVVHTIKSLGGFASPRLDVAAVGDGGLNSKFGMAATPRRACDDDDGCCSPTALGDCDNNDDDDVVARGGS